MRLHFVFGRANESERILAVVQTPHRAVVVALVALVR
jgi:hypothetical protein